MKELWKNIPGYWGFQASTEGRIRGVWKKKGSKKGIIWISGGRWILSKLKDDGMGYLRVGLRGQFRHVHILILETFVGKRPEGLEARHLDDDKWNNCLENLSWGTRSQNLFDAVRNGRKLVGKGLRKLTKEQRDLVVSKVSSGAKQKQVASEFGINQSTVSLIMKEYRESFSGI